MRIAVDVRCLMGGRRTGVEEYTLNLLLNLLEIDQENEYILFFNSWEDPIFDFSVFKKYPNVKIKRFRIPNKLLNFLFWYFNWPKIDQMIGQVDLVWMPNIIFGSVSKKTKLVVTIHDLSFERHPECFSWKRRMWHEFINPKKICQRADLILAVSQSTRNDIISIYHIKPEKIHMIHSAVDDRFQIIDRNNESLVKVKEKYNLPYKFILFLGTIEPRKNIISLIRAYNELQKTDDEEIKKYKLVISGAHGWSNREIFSEIEKSSSRKNILSIGFVADEDKPYLYNLASLFVYPSFFEGFGFPALEALKCGTPVISANNSSLPEIVGGGAILIDPDKPEDLHQAMKQVILARELKEIMIKKGLDQSSNFSWGKAAQETKLMLLQR